MTKNSSSKELQIGDYICAKSSDVMGTIIGIVDITRENLNRWYEPKYGLKCEETIGAEEMCTGRVFLILIDTEQLPGAESLELIYENEVMKKE